MRGVETRIQEIRHAVFTEVAKMAYEEGPVDKKIEALPYKIIPGETGNFRNDVFLERAIVGERLRMAMGLPYRGAAEPAPVSDGIMEADKPEGYYTPPLINVIKFACNACDEKKVHVTDGCQGCLAHPCMEVCPKKAISLDRVTGKSIIDQDACIKCGRCATVCSYNAIIVQERPCAKACGMKAITSDENGKATIDYDKCVSCGMCLVNCPFGAISDKSQIYQVIKAIQSGEKVYAAVAPAFVGQFGPKVTPEKLRAAMKELGFADVLEVAIGADLCAKQEAEDFLKEVPEELPFMATENIMMDAVKRGGNRQELHEKIREYSMLAGEQVKKYGRENDLVDRIAADPDFGMTKEEIVSILEPKNFVGRAPEQTREFLAEVIQPILDENKDILGVTAEINV